MNTETVVTFLTTQGADFALKVLGAIAAWIVGRWLISVALRLVGAALQRGGKADPTLAERVFPAAQLDHALPEADFVVLAAPETPETHHLMGARQLAAMKPTAFLVNMARGSLVDEAALVEALERHAIAGAALDVAEQEPLPPESRLWSLENVFITPHISAVSEALWDRQAQLLLENLDRWFSGRELLNCVDFKRGY